MPRRTRPARAANPVQPPRPPPSKPATPAPPVGCICSGIGVFIAGNPPNHKFLPCPKHPLGVKPGQTWEDAATERIFYCVRALVAVRELLWPKENPHPKWTTHTLAHVAHVLEFLRPAKAQEEDAP